MAWLNATPKPDENSKRAQAEPDKRTRAERMKKDGIVPAMPPVSAPHMIDRLVEIGLTEAAGMGSVPLSWVTIHAWQQCTGVVLEPWEARLIRKLSKEYLAEGQRAEDEHCPAPFRGEVTQAEIDAELRGLRAVLG